MARVSRLSFRFLYDSGYISYFLTFLIQTHENIDNYYHCQVTISTILPSQFEPPFTNRGREVVRGFKNLE